MNYAIEHEGRAFSPDGSLDPSPLSVAQHNAAVEAAELAWLQTHPPAVFLYVTGREYSYRVETWTGTVVDNAPSVGPRRRMGFGFHSYRRHITCRIYGQQYHGWYFESSGDYCRLYRSK